MLFWLILGTILCSWALLRLLGNERQARLQALRAAVASEAQTPGSPRAEQAASNHSGRSG